MRLDRRNQADEADKPQLAAQPGGWQGLPPRTPPALESVRPDSPHDPSVELVEEPADASPTVVVALFAGSDAGAERAAILYTLIATCTLQELDPWAYLKDVLEKLAAG